VLADEDPVAKEPGSENRAGEDGVAPRAPGSDSPASELPGPDAIASELPGSDSIASELPGSEVARAPPRVPHPAMSPDENVQYVKGVGPGRARVLAKIGVVTVEDLARHLPREHQDRRRMTPIGSLEPEMRCTVRGRVQSVRSRRIRARGGRQTVVSALVSDGTGTLAIEFWGQAFRARQLTEGREVLLSGRVTWDHGPRMSGPDVETALEEEEGEPIHAGRLVPIHPATKGITAPVMRLLTARALSATADAIEDPLPASLARTRGLLPLGEALWQAHFPASDESLEAARTRLKYEELFLLEVALAVRRRRQVLTTKPHRFRLDDAVDQRIRARFPFALTSAQERVVNEIRRDLASPHPMNRLLQGDVGSGKTAVAVYALLAAVASGLQGALLAPTEILAEQHLRSLGHYLEGSRVRLALVSGGGRAKAKREARAALDAGEIDIAIGTHALLEQGVRFRNLGLVIVDEQHKFGVLQRKKLRDKGFAPDLLVMSATPIPRTLTMTLYGDLDVSIIDELPPGRQPVKTVLCREGDRAQAYEWVRREVEQGRRVFHVVPLVDESEDLPLKAAETHALEMRELFPGIGVGLLHGRLPPAEKAAAMQAFRSGRTPILVATTVIEVGVDVPEATVLIVEHAERFGLAQLHQLRGRVGRGEHPSLVILFSDAKTTSARARLRALEATSDGFKIAEADLRIRGPGEVLGTRQSGLPELTLADLLEDADLLYQAREDAFALIERDPRLVDEGACVLAALLRKYGALIGKGTSGS